MSSPYRDAAIPTDDALPRDAAPAPLARLDVAGRAGAHGAHGRDGAPGTSAGEEGGRGYDAGPATPGEDGGHIRLVLTASPDDAAVTLVGELVTAGGERRPIHQTVVVAAEGTIDLLATGGAGGHGGNGGAGGDGARGHDGADATRWSSGEDGGRGGDGGDGGRATSGAPGGRGGDVVVAVSEADTPLLMLVRHDLRGGAGGAPGRNGPGGSGGAGGEGGDSYTWTETDSYTDSSGNRRTRSTSHRNWGGSDGPAGHSGVPGQAGVRAGARGKDGAFAIEVTTADGGVQTYASRYDLRLVGFSHDSLNEDCVYEPGELVRVFDLEVQNTGGMPTPTKDELALALVADGWVKPEPGELRCAPGLASGARQKIAGELRFRIADHAPTAPGDPLEVEESIHQRAMLPSVGREFEGFQAGAALEAGKFVIRYPVRVSPVGNLRSLIAGEATRVKFSVANQSRLALGARSPGKRVVRVRVAAMPDSELGDDQITLLAEGAEVAPSTGWTREIDVLEPGESVELELTLNVKPDAPEYRLFSGQVTLELGQLDQPAAARPIHIRAFDVRVARPFRVSQADLLLVVNHRTTREEIAAWEAMADRLSIALAIWDLSRERHLDLEAPLADGVSLAAWFEDKAIAILDNEIEGPDGPIRPHAFLAPDQAIRAAAAGIDIAFIGKGPVLDKLLVPGARDGDPPPATAKTFAPIINALKTTSRGTVTLHRRFWLRWWAKPRPEWLAKKALALSNDLRSAHPARRHVVVHRFQPEVAKSLWANRWRVGTLETLRTLDTAAGAIVRIEVGDQELHDPTYALSAPATTALLLMFGFDENLERLRRLLDTADVSAATLDLIVDALLVDLSTELVAMIAPRWRGAATGKELDAEMPRLMALANAKLAATYDTPGGDAVLRLAGRLKFLVESQVGWWERVPPWRWARRAPLARKRASRAIDRMLANAFGEDELDQRRADANVIANALRKQHRQLDRTTIVRKRRHWAMEIVQAPLAAQGVTTDVELMNTSGELVFAADEYDAIAAERVQAAERRAKLVSAADEAHAALRVAK